MLRIVIGVLMACLTTTAHAQTVLGGRVIDRTTRAPLPNVAVELIGAADTVLATVTTVSDGVFMLQAPAGGTYRVRLTAPGALPHVSDSVAVAGDQFTEREFPINAEPRPFYESEVDRPVIQLSGSYPRYPAALRARALDGCVIAQWVVDTKGRADMSTFTILLANHSDFANAVRESLPGTRFRPAELHNQKVRQVVQQPFAFSIGQPRVEVGNAVVRVDGNQSGRLQPVVTSTLEAPGPAKPGRSPIVCRIDPR